MRIEVVFLIFFIYCNSLYGQHFNGILGSNYQSVQNAYYNPSTIVNSKVHTDIQLFGMNHHLQNDAVYLKNQSLSTVFSSSSTQENIAWNANGLKKAAYMETSINLPSFTWTKGSFGVGLSLRGRSFMDVRRMDQTMVNFMQHGFSGHTVQHLKDLNLKNTRINGMAYGEINLQLAYTVYKWRNNYVTAGIGLKYLLPFFGAAAKIKDFQYQVLNDSAMQLDKLEADFMMAEPGLNGKGYALDLGLTWMILMDDAYDYYPHNPKEGCRNIPYRWKFGLSLIDLGWIDFKEATTFNFNFENFRYNLYNGANQIQEFNDLGQFPHKESGPTVKKPLRMYLPGAVVLSADYHWKKNWYINATYLHGVPKFPNTFGVRRAHVLSLTPRFETQSFEFAMPLSLYDWKAPQLGFSARLLFFTIGTNRLISWLFPVDLYATDIYFQAKIPIFNNPKCNRKVKRKEKVFRCHGK